MGLAKALCVANAKQRSPPTHAHKVSPLKVGGPPHPNREPTVGRHLFGQLKGRFDLLTCGNQVLPGCAGHALRSRLEAQGRRLSTSSQHILQRTGIGRLQRDALRRSAPWRLGSNGVVALHHDDQNCDCIQYINPPREPLQQSADPAQERVGGARDAMSEVVEQAQRLSGAIGVYA